MVALTTAERADFLAEVTNALPHTYTRTPRVANTSNPDYETFSDGTPVTGVPCFYDTVSRGRREEIGKVIIQEPRFVVAASDSLVAGDAVSSVRDAAGTLLLAGPLVVLTVEPMAGAGIALDKHVQLEGASASPSVGQG